MSDQAAKTATNENEQRPPMFYERPMPVSPSAHGKMKIRAEFDFRHAAKTNSVPLTAPEFVLAARSYPIIFVGDMLIPTAAIGIRQDENLFVNAAGEWDVMTYIPAYVRRFPFILLGKATDERLQLGVEETASSDKPDARALFEGDKETQIVRDALNMCEQFHGAYRFTADFSKALKDSGLIEERELDVNMANGEKTTLGTFQAVNEDKFKNLPDATVLEWRKKGFLHAIYFHLQSLNNWESLLAKANERFAAMQAKTS
ncbi:MAG: SapC family protein [Rhodospirillaceae bacterium]|nr:SapC family protein [Rhodospirillaceae bacterium]